MLTAPVARTNPQAGVMTTSLATTPEQNPSTLGLPLKISSARAQNRPPDDRHHARNPQAHRQHGEHVFLAHQPAIKNRASPFTECMNTSLENDPCRTKTNS